MHYKAGRQNHDFQILYFMVGACHTADAAYALLMDQLEDRSNAIKLAEGSRLRSKAKRIKAERTLEKLRAIHGNIDSELVVDKIDDAKVIETIYEAKATLSDIQAMAETEQKVLQAAIAERDFILRCIEEIRPYRRYAHLSDADAAQAAQREEWLLELQRRAENFIITNGTIPADHFNAMRQHPDYINVLAPVVKAYQQLAAQGKVQEMLERTERQTHEEFKKALPLPNAFYAPTLPSAGTS